MIFQRLTSFFAAAVLSVFILAFPPGGYAVVEEFKYLLFLALCGGYCAAIVIIRAQLALTGILPPGKPSDFIRSIPAAGKLCLLFLFFTVLSALLSVYDGTFFGAFRREGVLTITIYVLVCIFVSKYFRPQKWMLFLLGATACLFCLLSFVQLTGANPFGLYPEGLNYYGAGVYYSGEFLGTLGNAGLGAAFLSITAGVFSMALVKFDFRQKWIPAIPLFLAALQLFEAGVDAGVLALAAGSLIMLPIAVTSRKGLQRTLFVFAVVGAAFALSRALIFGDGYIRFRPDAPTPIISAGLAAVFAVLSAVAAKTIYLEKIPPRLYRVCAAAVVLAVMCFAALYLWLYSGESSGMIYEASEVLRGRWDDNFGTRRVYIWRNVMSGVSENLLLGTGPDTLGFWGIAPFTRYSEELGRLFVAEIDAAHNEYMHILACTGLFSLLSYLGALGLAAVKWFRFSDNPLCAVSGAGVLFYCIQAFFGISMNAIAPLFWIVFAVTIATNEGGIPDAKKERN